MSNFTMGTILGKGFAQAQVHTNHSMSAVMGVVNKFRHSKVHRGAFWSNSFLDDPTIELDNCAL